MDNNNNTKEKLRSHQIRSTQESIKERLIEKSSPKHTRIKVQEAEGEACPVMKEITPRQPNFGEDLSATALAVVAHTLGHLASRDLELVYKYDIRYEDS
ncbi:hypothetical protein L484_015430 [Morus notabilis]|uniref:Uncharacterized protein n=1 Tax=Morus notabilis TaxID=981085 RepID=W9RHL9_9ROSA|nr:hypothetical protein L484_015430 [Morus notabilis]